MRSAWKELDKEPKMTKLKPYGYVMKFESGIEAFNTVEYELPDDKRISSVPLYANPVKELDRKLLDKTIIDQQNEIKDLRKNLDVALMIVNKSELTDEEIAKVVHELNQKANTPERWVTAMQIGAETIIQLRDELRKSSEK